MLSLSHLDGVLRTIWRWSVTAQSGTNSSTVTSTPWRAAAGVTVRLGVNVLTLLARRLRGRPCRVFNSDMKVRIDARHFVYPDAAVSCDSRDLDDEDPSFISFPALIVEVLSENSTADYDRGGKFDFLYSRLPGLREYMLREY